MKVFESLKEVKHQQLSLEQNTTSLIRQFILPDLPAQFISIFSAHAKLSFIATDESKTSDLLIQMGCLEALARGYTEHAESFANKMVITKLCKLLKSKKSAIFLKAA